MENIFEQLEGLVVGTIIEDGKVQFRHGDLPKRAIRQPRQIAGNASSCTLTQLRESEQEKLRSHANGCVKISALPTSFDGANIHRSASGEQDSGWMPGNGHGGPPKEALGHEPVN